MAVTLRVPTIFSAVDGVSPVYDKMTKKGKSFTESLNNVGKGAGIAALAIVAPLGVAVDQAVKFEDKMSDVAKTTGLSGKPLEDYGKSLLKMSGDTRTSIEDLQTIGEIGGQLGVASKDLLGFTDASNKFAVALGNDYSGGVEQAISQVGKIQNLFKDTRSLNIADVINKSGSAINQLGAVGSGTSENINDFILRIGALPDAIKPTLTNTAALGTFFEEMGIDSQIAAGGLSNFFLVAGKNIGGFATQMGVSTQEAKTLLATDPTEFAKKFSSSLNGLTPEKLATKLDALKIGSQETIKVLGALGAGTSRLTELQGVSADAFQKGTSLLDEYNTKNSNTAASLAKAKNNIQAFSITLGTQLLPLISKTIDELKPIIQGFTQWASDSPNLAKNLVRIAIGLGAIWTVSKLVTFWTYASATAMGIYGAVTGVASISIGGNTVALAAYNATSKIFTGFTYIATAAQWAWNAAMLANPIGLIIVAVIALIAWIALVINKWDEWGASITLLMGPLGLVISMVQSLISHWDMLSEAFTTGGFIEGIKTLGLVIFDAILMPLQQALGLLSKIPGLGGLADLSNDVGNFRDSLGLTESKPALDSPLVANQKATNESIVTKQNSINMNINDPGNNVGKVTSNGPLNIPIKTSSTTSSKNWKNGN